MRSSRIVACLAVLTPAFAKWPVQQYRTENFVVPVFNVTRSGSTPSSPGDLFLAIVTPPKKGLRGPMIVRDDGELIWHGSTKNAAVYNFQAQQLGNQTVLSYWAGVLDISHGYGAVYILNQEYEQIYKVCLPDDVKKYVRTNQKYPGNCLIDKHESIITNRNSIIVTGYNVTQTDLSALGGSKNGWIFDSVFYELEIGTNKLLFMWRASDHVPVTASNFVNNTSKHKLFLNNQIVGTSIHNPWDYFHINSVESVGDGYLVNSRYTWSFYFLNKNGGIVRTLEGSHGGDFKLADQSTFFSYQHNARYRGQQGSNYSVSIFNNDNFSGEVSGVNSSCGYLFTLDTASMTAYTTKHLYDQAFGPIYANAEGSYQILENDHVLLGYGVQPLIIEYDAQNQPIYTLQYANLSTPYRSYRAYRLPWASSPKTKPKVVVDIVPTKNGKKVVAFMSWNGATNYTHWNIMAGTSQTSLNNVAQRIPRNGFETSQPLNYDTLTKQSWSHAKVQALDTNGNVLGESSVVQIKALNHTIPELSTTTTGGITAGTSAPTSTSSGGVGGLRAHPTSNAFVVAGIAGLLAFME